MGKTTLAIRAAELAAPGHYDDILFLSAKQTAMDPHGPHDESPFAVSGFTQMLDAIARVPCFIDARCSIEPQSEIFSICSRRAECTVQHEDHQAALR